MIDDVGEPAFLTNLGFLVTYRCQVACPHCLVRAGPHRTEQMALEDAFAWIDEAARYGSGRVRAISFTGGEPFHDPERLRRMVAFTAERGLLPTAVTNGAWAESPEIALEVLRSMPALRVLSVSADRHHERRIPLERVRNAVLAAKDLGLEYTVSVCTEDEADPVHRDLLRRLEAFASAGRIETVITFAVGRAEARGISARHTMIDRPPPTACSSSATPLVLPDGRVYACVGPVIDLKDGHPLLLGNLRTTSLREILDAAEVNPILHLLRVWGPTRLLELLAERGERARLPRLFVQNSLCSICYTLMSDGALVRAMGELARDAALIRKTAWARVHYLREERMVEALASAEAVEEPPLTPAGAHSACSAGSSR